MCWLRKKIDTSAYTLILEKCLLGALKVHVVASEKQTYTSAEHSCPEAKETSEAIISDLRLEWHNEIKFFFEVASKFHIFFSYLKNLWKF